LIKIVAVITDELVAQPADDFQSCGVEEQEVELGDAKGDCT
jgi:hypothetical protein